MAEIELICVGKITDRSITEKADTANNVFFTGYQPNPIVSHLYKRAEALLYVSRNEGFGLPILEAFANNCPVIASRLGSIPEVAGDAAHYVDPLSPETIRNAILEFLGNEDLKKNLRIRGQHRLSFYSWDRSAEKLISIIQQMKPNQS
jgi:glycosyltransferase involved in cell wall biosynthesis